MVKTTAVHAHARKIGMGRGKRLERMKKRGGVRKLRVLVKRLNGPGDHK